MKALMKLALGDGNMDLQDMPIPSVTQNKVKIEVAYVGVCGSDLKIRKGQMATDPPVIVGHEFSGTIVEVGQGVTNFKVGDRVVSETAGIICGACEYCMSGNYLMCPSRRSLGYKENGAFAKYVIARQDMLHRIPDSVSFEEAAVTEPAAVAFHAVYDYARLLPTSNVLISGPGTLGILVAQMAKTATKNVVVCGLAQDAHRLEILKNMGVKVVFSDQENMKEFANQYTGGIGFDVAFDCTGAPPAISTDMDCLKNSGTLVQVGIPHQTITADYGLIPMKELTIKGVYGSKYSNWTSVLKMVEEHQVDLKSMVTSIYSLDEWEKAYETAADPKQVKVLVKP